MIKENKIKSDIEEFKIGLEFPESEGQPNEAPIDKFRVVAQNFVSSLDVLWQYTKEIGKIAERTSLTNLACLPTLLSDILKRSKAKSSDDKKIGSLIFEAKYKGEEKPVKNIIDLYEPKHIRDINKYLSNHDKALRILHETVLQQLVNAWERVISELLEWKLQNSPENMPKDKSLTYSKIVELGDFENAKRFVIEEEINDFLRNKNTAQQIKYFNDEFNANFKSAYPDFQYLQEVVLRRHAIVHAGGIVSQEYIDKTLKIRGLDSSSLSKGDSLIPDAEYIIKAWGYVYSAGVILTHLVSIEHARQINSKDDEDSADSFMLNAAYINIQNNQYKPAITILEYAEKRRLAKSSSNLMAKVNLAQAHKWSGNDEKCDEVLKGYDWSSAKSSFRLCVSALKNDIETFKETLKIAAAEKSVGVSELLIWPVFRLIQKNKDYLSWIQEAYECEESDLKTDKLEPKLLDFEPEERLKELLENVVKEKEEEN